MTVARCPFCGRAGHPVTVDDESWVSCSRCGARGPLSGDTKTALAAWNYRDVTVSAVYGYEAGLAASKKP